MFKPKYKSSVVARASSMLVVVSGLVACSSGNHSDLTAFMENVKNQPRGAIEPLPPLRTYDSYVYNVAGLRSPFDPPVDATEIVARSGPKVEPEVGRLKEYLESFNIDSLSMVGSLGSGSNFWALILDGDGGINRVGVGSYMGKNHGKVVSASPTQIDLIEIVPDGHGGWLQRPRTLKLSEKE